MNRKNLITLIIIACVFLFFSNNQGNSESSVSEVAGAIRNTGSGWKPIANKTHYPINISKVETSNDRITVYHNVSASQVITMIVTPDETMSSEGYRVGVSGGLDYSYILIFDKDNKLVNPNKYINSSGNIWIYGKLK